MKEKVNDLLNIPNTIVIGFREREGTFTGRLGYITYYRGKTIAKQTSWEGWRDENIPPLELENAPISGLELNKEVVGGEKSGWNQRHSYCRVYDPRGFEFEITFDNLLFILQETGYTPEEGLRGEFVYAWDRADLVLLPISSEDYKASKKLKEDSDRENIGARNLVIGKAYKTKHWPTAYYIGKLDWRIVGRDDDPGEGFKKTQYHSFLTRRKQWDYVSQQEREVDTIVGINSMANILLPLDLPPKTVPEIEIVIDKFKESIAGNLGKITELRILEPEDSVKQEFNDVINKNIPNKKVYGAIQVSPTVIDLYQIALNDQYVWSGGSYQVTGKQFIECSRFRVYSIKGQKFEVDSCITTGYCVSGKVESDDPIPEGLIPINFRTYDATNIEVKVGDIWYSSGIYTYGVWRPEIDL